jgi:stage V sporulation protein R
MNVEELEPKYLRFQEEVEKVSKKHGLDFFETVFYMTNWEDQIQIIGYGGFPRRPHHWKFGQDAYEFEQQNRYGVSRVYEMVINNDPCYAYIHKSNSDTEIKFVICHVYGHNDFFKNNIWFSKTNRDMVREMNWHAEKVDRLEQRYGQPEVEKMVEICMSLDNLIDPMSVFLNPDFETIEKRVREAEMPRERPRLHNTGDRYLDSVLNTKEHRLKEMRRIHRENKEGKRFPRNLQKDVVKFIIDNAKYRNHNLPDWKLDMLSLFRDEFYYFAPQRSTKIMNEGWATYWHHKLMIEEGFVGDKGVFDFSKIHSGVTAMSNGQFNPYALGLKMWEWIEHRWDTGKHGPEYDKCDDRLTKFNWDTKEMNGKEKIFHVRKYYNDIMLIDEFFDKDFCDANKLFGYGQELPQELTRDKQISGIKKYILGKLYNSGEPIIFVKDGDFNNKGELLLHHDFEFAYKTLDIKKTIQVMKNLRTIWGKDISMDTKRPNTTKSKKNRGEYEHVRLMVTESSVVSRIIGNNDSILKEEDLDV